MWSTAAAQQKTMKQNGLTPHRLIGYYLILGNGQFDDKLRFDTLINAVLFTQTAFIDDCLIFGVYELHDGTAYAQALIQNGYCVEAILFFDKIKTEIKKWIEKD